MAHKRKPQAVAQTSNGGRTGNVILVAVIAFTAGCFSTWLVMRQPAHPQPSATRESAEELPPDTSRMSPAQSALTLGNWHYDGKRWPQAITAYQLAIQLGLDNPDVRTDLGNSYRFSGQPQKALEQYRIAQTQNAQHEQSLFNTATLYAQVINDSAKATEVAREYVRRFPQGQSIAAAQQLAGANGEMNGRESVANWLKEQTPSADK